MVWPIVAVGAAGVAGGALAAMGLTKKEASITDSHNQQNVYHQPYETYMPQIGYAPVTTYSYQGAQYIINSPGATQTPKQAVAVTSDPSQEGTWDADQQANPSSNTGSGAGSLFGDVDWTSIAIIGAVAVVGYAFFKR